MPKQNWLSLTLLHQQDCGFARMALTALSLFSTDQWTPLHLNELFLRRIKRVPVKSVMLEKAGHYPIEQPTINEFCSAIARTVEPSRQGEQNR
jgi:hypothetical protein